MTPGQRHGVEIRPYVNEEGEGYVLKDWLGNDIFVGDRILYPMQSGRCSYMAVGVIKKIAPMDSELADHRREMKRAAADIVTYSDPEYRATPSSGYLEFGGRHGEKRDATTWAAWVDELETRARARLLTLQQKTDFTMKVLVEVESDNYHTEDMWRGGRLKKNVTITRYDNITKYDR